MSRMEDYLWPEGSRRGVWMIADAARDRRIYGLLLDYFYSDHYCLFSGPLTQALQVTAPYLVQLEYDDRKTQTFLSRAFGNSWGVFLRCDARMEAVRRHLRSLLWVRDPKGNRVLFRHYDPRVLRPYLPSCTSEELERVFGPVECFWTEGIGGDTLVEFELTGQKLVTRELPVVSNRGEDIPAPGKRTRSSFQPDRGHGGMLVIRSAQWSMFSKSEVRKFEDWMVQHLRKFFPSQCNAMGEARLRETIQFGTARAASHGLTVKRDVCKYIDVLVVLGRYFEEKRQYGWAARILEQRIAPGWKAQALLDAGVRYLKAAGFTARA